MIAIYKKELRAYFNSMIGWMFLAFFFLGIGFYHATINLLQGYGLLTYALTSVTIIIILIIPIFTMRIMAEEGRQKTDQLLYTSPVSIVQIVLGKFFAMATIFAIGVAVLALYPLTMMPYGDVVFVQEYVSLAGFFLMGCVYMAIGMFISSLTTSQILAAVITIGVFLFSFLFRAIGVEIPTNTDIGGSQPDVVNAFALLTSAAMITAGYILNHQSFRAFWDLLTQSSAYRCDFTNSHGVAVTMINTGVFGLFVTGYYNVIGASLTGPTAGSIICLLAVTSCGTHMLNMIPIMLGYALASTFCAFDLTTQAIVVGLCFAAALSPIPSRYGSLMGVVAGMMHAIMVTTIVTFHGGLCLYNGGFTAGITAIILVPFLEFFLIAKDKPALLPTFRKIERME